MINQIVINGLVLFIFLQNPSQKTEQPVVMVVDAASIEPSSNEKTVSSVNHHAVSCSIVKNTFITMLHNVVSYGIYVGRLFPLWSIGQLIKCHAKYVTTDKQIGLSLWCLFKYLISQSSSNLFNSCQRILVHLKTAQQSSQRHHLRKQTENNLRKMAALTRHSQPRYHCHQTSS